MLAAGDFVKEATETFLTYFLCSFFYENIIYLSKDILIFKTFYYKLLCLCHLAPPFVYSLDDDEKMKGTFFGITKAKIRYTHIHTFSFRSKFA